MQTNASAIINSISEPDRDTDWTLFKALVPADYFSQPFARIWRENEHVSFEDELGFIHEGEGRLPKLTRSTDDATSFAERCGYQVAMIEIVDDNFVATLRSRTRTLKGRSCVSRAVAILAALANSKLETISH